VHSDLIGLLFRSIAPYDKKKHVSLSIIIVTLHAAISLKNGVLRHSKMYEVMATAHFTKIKLFSL